MSYDFADRLIKMRLSRGMSQEDLAKSLGLSRQAISKWERAESAPDIGNLVALAEVYGVTLDELVHGDIKKDEEAVLEDVRAEEVAVEDTAQEVAVAEATANEVADVEKTAQEAEMQEDARIIEVEDVVLSPQPTMTVEEAVFDSRSPKPIEEAACDSRPSKPIEEAACDSRPSRPIEDVICNPQSMMPPPPIDSAPIQVVATMAPVPAPSKSKSPFFSFPYPVLVVLIYLMLGFVFGLWHPGWVIFFTIPFYYWIASVITNDPEFESRHDANSE